MKVIRLHIYPNKDREFQATAIINVPGLGEVQIEHSLSEEMCSAIQKEALVALRLKLGQVITQTLPDHIE